MSAERPIPGRQPDRFTQIIQDSLSGKEKFEELGRELSGFRGKMAAEITAWHAEGLGKAIGYGLPSGNIYGRQSVDNNGYRGVLFALPLTDETITGYNKRMLLLIPGEEVCDYIIVSPKKPTTIEEQVEEWEGESFIKAFDTYFLPSVEPHMHPSLKPLPGQNPADIFLQMMHLTSFK
ncbi:MAG: hypothetical protein H0W89_08005 [Candidatus Levybacteria bacterium]|nr:hypothetical protein [Candidatus Levybacteria bacterium]